MTKIKIQKLALKFFAVIFLTSSLFVSLPAGTAHAAITCVGEQTATIADGREVCQEPANSTGCPETMSKISKEGIDPETGGKYPIQCIPKTVDAEANESMLQNIQWITTIQQAANYVIWPVLMLTGGLMDNSLLFGGGMEENLRNIWIPIRNLVNILFVILLVGIALYNVLGIGDENSEYAVKSILPKIIIGIIAVNFSFLGIKVVLDGINVLTVSIFSLPNQVSEGLASIVKLDGNSNVIQEDQAKEVALCAAVSGHSYRDYVSATDDTRGLWLQEAAHKGVLGSKSIPGFTQNMSIEQMQTLIGTLKEPQKAEVTQAITAKTNGFFCNKNKTLSTRGKSFLGNFNGRNAALAMALNMGKIQFYTDLHYTGLKSISGLLINTLLSMLFYLVFVASFLALFIVLLGRMVVLWLCIAISPVLVLLVGSSGLKEKFGEFGKIVDQFTKNAIAPVLIALSMTIGWIMLSAIQKTNLLSSDSGLMMDPTSGIPVIGLNSLQDLMVGVGTIAVVWLGVFSAAEGTIAEGATNWMRDSLKAAGKYVGTIPFKHIPIVPITVGGAAPKDYTLSQIGQAIKLKINEESGGPNRLYNDLTGRKPPTAQTFNSDRVKTKEDAYSLMKRLGKDGTLGDERTQIALQDFKRNNAELFTEINNELGTNLLEDLSSTNPKTRKDAAEKILKHSDVKSASPMEDAIEREAAAPPATSTKKTFPPVADIGDTEPIVMQDSSGKAAAAAPITVRADLKGINGGLTKLGGLLANQNPVKIKKADVINVLEGAGLKNGAKTSVLSPEALKARLGEERYTNLLAVLDPADPVNALKLLQGHLKKGLTPAPPAAAPPAPSP